MAPLVPRPAASIILLRPSAAGPEVLMLKRTQGAAFLAGAYVFPGGALDAADSDPRITRRVLGFVHKQLPVEYWVAAVRECFEEAGVLLAVDVRGKNVEPARVEKLQDQRKASFVDLLESEDLYIPAQDITYYAHWITAPGRSRRFDARFFLAAAPAGQQGSHDANEMVHDIWIRPQEALERGERKEIELVFATQHTLRDLSRHAGVPQAMEAARAAPEVDTNRACWAKGKEGPKLFRRADPQYFEIHWSDPEETGETSYDIVPGTPKRLDQFVTRITAPNPGAMTGPGTNSYLVGGDELAVIDPGPDIASHVDKILEAAQGRLRWIICTHTHFDHSPAAARLKQATGATVIGRPAPAGQDQTFQPDRVLSDGEELDISGRSLRAIHTPGHASNHLCYLLGQTKMLFTGDHVMQGSTVVINPPDGDMRVYLASLERLLGIDIAIIAPGHGYLIGAPHREVRRLIAHRLGRENKVVASLGKVSAATLEELVLLVYDDVPPRLHPIAARSLRAHLDKLVAEGRARAERDRFALIQ